jgi:hypothetical protein
VEILFFLKNNFFLQKMKWQNEQKGGMSDFQACSPTVTHTALRARSRIAFDALSLSFHKERAKEKEPGRSLRGLPASRRSDNERRGFCFIEIPPSWAHKRTPEMGLRLASFFAIPFCIKFVQVGMRHRWQESLLLLVAGYSRVRILTSKCECKP